MPIKDRVTFTPEEINSLVLAGEGGEYALQYRMEALTPHSQRFNKLQDVFNEQSEQPPGGDPYMTLAFKAIQGNPEYLNFLLACQDERRRMGRPITYGHLTNLGAVDVINYEIMFGNNSVTDKPWDYPQDPALHLDTIGGWDRLYEYMLMKHQDDIGQLILDRDIQTTHHTRSISWPTIAKILPDNFTGEDWGCSANIPWSYLAEGYSFTEKIVDHTEFNGQKGIFLANAQRPLNIGHIEGIDLRNPLHNEDDFNWFLSCRHFDEITSGKIESTKRKLERYKHGVPKVSFRAGNILDPEVALQGDVVDIVTLSTILYQFPHDIRKAVIINALNKVHPEHGVVAINDYCTVEKVNGDAASIVFTEGREEGAYSTVLIGNPTGYSPWKVATYRTSSCTEIYPTLHTERLIQLCEESKRV